MSKIKFTIEDMQLMKLFNNFLKADVKDFIQEKSRYIIIVTEGNLQKAIGPNGINVKNLEKKTNRKIKIVEFSPNVLTYITNFVHPIKLKSISEIQPGVFELEAPDIKSRGFLIGKNASNLRQLEEYIQRFYDVTEIKVKK